MQQGYQSCVSKFTGKLFYVIDRPEKAWSHYGGNTKVFAHEVTEVAHEVNTADQYYLYIFVCLKSQ